MEKEVYTYVQATVTSALSSHAGNFGFHCTFTGGFFCVLALCRSMDQWRAVTYSQSHHPSIHPSIYPSINQSTHLSIFTYYLLIWFYKCYHFQHLEKQNQTKHCLWHGKHRPGWQHTWNHVQQDQWLQGTFSLQLCILKFQHPNSSGCISTFPFWYQPAQLYHVSSVSVAVLCSGPGPLWDDCEGLAEESSDDARPHSRVLCRVQDTGRVCLLLTFCLHEEGHNAL